MKILSIFLLFMITGCNTTNLQAIFSKRQSGEINVHIAGPADGKYIFIYDSSATSTLSIDKSIEKVEKKINSGDYINIQPESIGPLQETPVIEPIDPSAAEG